MFGGQVLSYRPAGSDSDVLWVSPLVATPPTPIRGGIPICWPYFGKENQTDSDVPSHGYARTAQWRATGSQTLADGSVELQLAPEGLDWLGLRVALTVHVGETLRIGLHTTNIGEQQEILTEALHNYLHVSDATTVRVDGLSGLSYEDKFDDLTVRHKTATGIFPTTSSAATACTPTRAVRIGSSTVGSTAPFVSTASGHAPPSSGIRDPTSPPGWRTSASTGVSSCASRPPTRARICSPSNPARPSTCGRRSHSSDLEEPCARDLVGYDDRASSQIIRGEFAIRGHTVVEAELLDRDVENPVAREVEDFDEFRA